METVMLSRRMKVIFWLAIGAVLLISVRQIFADPTQTNTLASSPIVLTEFMASNGGELADEDGDQMCSSHGSTPFRGYLRFG